MASGSNKFGTFAGVFTPSILTILGVIMYLRLPAVVGQSGLGFALAIMVLAHVISVSTGLSISSIATDKKVGAGGAYYIISRSLGLPIGGTLGLALFLGLSFSIALYTIGFSESFLGTLGLPTTPNAIRVCGTITIIAITVVTFISTALAIKSQFIILGLIVLSLVAIFFGGGAVPGAPFSTPSETFDFAKAFAIFFPAVTGFTAGVNMSGDLRDPKRAIPLGTMAAIAVGMIIYMGLAVFVAFRIPPDQMGSSRVFVENALFSSLPGGSWPVLGGIWGATLSSALGSILGAPRILQALSVDRVTPRFFAKGSGKTNEPRRALFVVFAIGEAGILMGELNAIAEVVSMFFIATYGFLNMVCFIESWASTDFRPAFRIPRAVSLVGAVTCVVVMIQLNIVATIGAAVLLAGVFLYLERRQLALESGDTWEGVWSSMIRSGVDRLARGRRATRNFRPNVLCFTGGGLARRSPLVELGQTLARGRGVMTEFELLGEGETRVEEPSDEEARPPGIYRRAQPEGDRFATMEAVLRYHGYAGFEPNVVLADFRECERDPGRFAAFVEATRDRDLNLLLLDAGEGEGFGARSLVDVYWAAGHGSLLASLALVRLLTSGDPWNLARVRFFLVVDDGADADPFFRTVERLLAEARLDASIKVLNNALGGRTLTEWIRAESKEADLVLAGLPDELGRQPQEIEPAIALSRAVDSVLLVRGSSAFPEVLTARAVARDSKIPDEGVTRDLPPLELPASPVIAAEVGRFAAEVDGALEALHGSALARAYGASAGLVEAASRLVESTFGQLDRASGLSEVRQRRVVSKAHGAFLRKAGELARRYETEDLPPVFDALEHRVRSLLDDVARLAERSPERLVVAKPESAFAIEESDTPAVRRFKRRGRMAARLNRKPPSYVVPLAPFHAYYFRYRALEAAWAALEAAARTTYETALELGKTLTAVRLGLGALAGTRDEEGRVTAEALAAERDRALERLAALGSRVSEGLAAGHRRIRRAAREIAQAYADDLDRMDVLVRARRDRRLPRAAYALPGRLQEAPGAFRTNLRLLVHRAELELLVGSFQQRLAVAAGRAKDLVVQRIEEGAASRISSVLVAVRTYREGLGSETGRRFSVRLDQPELFDVDATVEELVRAVGSATSELPESLETLGDEAASRLAEEPFDEAEVVTVSVRRLVDFLAQAEFIGKLKKALSEVPVQESRSLGVAQDVIRLVAFNLEDLDSGEEELDEPFVERMGPVVDSGLTRLEAEVERLAQLPAEAAAHVEERLKVVVERTEAYAITGSDDSLRQYVGTEGARKEALSRLGRAAESMRAALREGLGALLYRRSAGVLLSRRLGTTLRPTETVVERVRALVASAEPSQQVLQTLPFYYQQPFLGRTRISADFWVGRNAELALAAAAVERHRSGVLGTLLVTGERGAGKTAFCRYAGNRLMGRGSVVHLFPPRGGSPDPDALRQRLEEETGRKGTADEILAGLPDGGALVFHDLELWWERSDRGFATLDALRALHQAHGRRILFVYNVGLHALRFVEHLAPRLADEALAVVECGPVDAAALKEVVMLRHRSTGLRFDLRGSGEEGLPEWRLARLFGRHFSYSGGLIGVTLQAWAAQVTGVDDGVVSIGVPRRPSLDALHELRVEWVALLVELVLHGQLTAARLERVTGVKAASLRREVEALLRMGLVVESAGGVLEVNRFVDHLVTEHLLERGVIE